jgi:RND family efflux transporter MFP subunit
MEQFVRAYIFATTLLLIIFGSIGGFLYQKFSALAEADFSSPPVTVSVAQAEINNIARRIKAVGTINAQNASTLSAEVNGRIVRIGADGGDQVTEGHLLVQLDDAIESAELARFEADLRLTKTLLERDSSLAKEKAISQTQLDTRTAQYEAAKAQVEETKARIEQKRIQAPFSGSVGIPLVEVGDYVTTGTPLIHLTDTALLEAEFSLPANQARLVPLGTKMAAYDTRGETLAEGRVTERDPALDPIDRTRRFRAAISTGHVLPGEFVRIELILNESDAAVVVPETAVTYALQGDAVYIADLETNTVELRLVKTGDRFDRKVEIKSGVEEGEYIVTAGQHKLFPGASISVGEAATQ